MAMGIFKFSVSISETKVLETEDKKKNLVCSIQIKAPSIMSSLMGSLLLIKLRKTSKEHNELSDDP